MNRGREETPKPGLVLADSSRGRERQGARAMGYIIG